MNNHGHQILAYRKSLTALSNFMRVAHGMFGQRYNRIHKRTGKVANERPRTSLIQSDAHAMRAHFYVEANPIRANICKAENLKLHKFSSYRFYAFGIVDEQTRMLTPPSWYLKLGTIPEERQARYRSLFYAYLQASGDTANESWRMHAKFIGDAEWLRRQHVRIFGCRRGEQSLRIGSVPFS
jgi:putative transposase